MAKVHFWVGIIGILTFLSTGLHMDHHLGHLKGMEDGPRMLYRSSHIYILLASLINLVIGIYSPSKDESYTWFKYLYSLSIIALPCMFLAGFFIQPNLADFHRPFTRRGIYIIFLATILYLIYLAIRKIRNLITKHTNLR